MPQGRLLLPALAMAITAMVFSIVALSILLAASHELNLSEGQTTTLIIGLYGIPGALSLLLTFVFRQPLMFAWNIGGLIFLATLADRFTYNEMLGATMVAGIAVALIGVLGVSTRLAAVIPPPIIFGILAGLVMPYVVFIFTEFGKAPIIIGFPLLAYLLARRLADPRVPPVLPAVVTAFIVAWFLGEVSVPSTAVTLPHIEGTQPAFSLAAVLTIAPVLTILIAVQGNLTAIMYLKHQDYTPPQRLIDIASGVASAVFSAFGAALICMASLLTPVTAGPEAGDWHFRHWSVFAAGSGFVLIALLSGMAAVWGTIVPAALLISLAGLALIGVLSQALQEITRGPLMLGPLFAFVVTSSDLSLFGLGSVFWALLLGMGVSILLENQRMW
jgi:benzoate membrane transport protein